MIEKIQDQLEELQRRNINKELLMKFAIFNGYLFVI